MTDRVCSRCAKVEQLRRGLCHACYEVDRRAGLVESLVPANKTRAYIAVLVEDHGWHYRELARAAKVDRLAVAFIMGGREFINARTAEAILAVDPGSRPQFVRDSWSTRRAKAKRTAARTDFAPAAEPAEPVHIVNVELEQQRAEQRRRQQQIMAQREREVAKRRDRAGEGGGLRLVMADMAEQHWIDDAVCAQTDPEAVLP